MRSQSAAPVRCAEILRCAQNNSTKGPRLYTPRRRMADDDQPLTIPAAIDGAARRSPGRPAYIEPGARRTHPGAELHVADDGSETGRWLPGLQRGDRVAV